jgi:hypothetical protein
MFINFAVFYTYILYRHIIYLEGAHRDYMPPPIEIKYSYINYTFTDYEFFSKRKSEINVCKFLIQFPSKLKQNLIV